MIDTEVVLYTIYEKIKVYETLPEHIEDKMHQVSW